MTMPSWFLWLNFAVKGTFPFMTLVVVPVAAKAMYSLMNYNSEGFQAAKDWAMQAMSDLAAVVD